MPSDEPTCSAGHQMPICGYVPGPHNPPAYRGACDGCGVSGGAGGGGVSGGVVVTLVIAKIIIGRGTSVIFRVKSRLVSGNIK